ncbi:nitrite reductase (NAD(P)H) large subunit [Catenovulum agarivorans DS-2]|uniref:Nitrite reductase (NAD(P)H) large subunit n=1 Tax=Catenovulum agarivorans DS-2 TaxID=1328313 RepID=W7R2W2_9ALTE|nr:nitrite reductase (NAD(P)H) large subunit [Catenovulum agarivorans DS-2]
MTTQQTSKQRVVVVGNGMVGHHFVDQLVNQTEQEYQISVLSAEPRLAYDRVHLSEYFAGKSAEDLSLTSEAYYQSVGVNFYTNSKVTNIDKINKTVTTEQGMTLEYDKLILATGSFPFVPPIPGKERENCFVYRTIEDLDDIKAAAEKCKVGLVVGGGLLGLEAANALKQLGLKTHVIEFAPQLMPTQIDIGGGRALKAKIEELGVEVHTEKATKQIVDGDTCVHKLEFADGSILETDLVLFSAGIRPQDQLARDFDIQIGERGGIVINDHCQTSDADIYAIGECALWQNRIFGLVSPGYTMARAAVSHIIGGDFTFAGADMSTKLKLMGVAVGSIGDAHARTPNSVTFCYENPQQGIYKKVVTDADQKHLIGAVLIGDTSEYDNLLQFHLQQLELEDTPESLIVPMLQGEPVNPALNMTDSSFVCLCNMVTKGTIAEAVRDGCDTVEAIKTRTRASSSCGTCVGMVQNVIDLELANLAVEV